MFPLISLSKVIDTIIRNCDTREEITKSKFNTMIGLIDRERVDEELYGDFESAKAREVCKLVHFVNKLKFCSVIYSYA